MFFITTERLAYKPQRDPAACELSSCLESSDYITNVALAIIATAASVSPTATGGADSNRVFELMVWLDKGPERRPSGRAPVALYTDSSGRLFDVYVKGQDDPGYIAYVAQQEVTSDTLNWNEFFTNAKNNASTYGVRAINDDWCLANILLGTEIWWGEGDFVLDYYQIERSY